MRRIPRALIPAVVIAVGACDTAPRSAPAEAASATTTPTPGLRAPIVREAPQPAERVAPAPTPTANGD